MLDFKIDSLNLWRFFLDPNITPKATDKVAYNTYLKLTTRRFCYVYNLTVPFKSKAKNFIL